MRHSVRTGCFPISVAVTLVQLLVNCGLAQPSPINTERQNGSQTQPATLHGQVRRSPGYTIFATNCSLPTTVLVSNQTLLVDGTIALDLSQSTHALEQLSPLAAKFEVPVPVLERALRGPAVNTQPRDQVVQELRATVVDYKFLVDRWTRYHPGAAGEKLKAEALQSLQTGDLDKSWAMYDALAKPQPPAGLHTVNPVP